MSRLMKYEFRKTMFPKLVLLGITAVMEILFLIGMFIKKDSSGGFDNAYATGGMVGLVLTASFGITFIGLYSLMVLHNDLGTKQGYMLFMTPNNSYKILGAKVLENALSLGVVTVFFGVLATIDLEIVLKASGETKSLMDMVQMMLRSMDVDIQLKKEYFWAFLFVLVATWLELIMTAGLALVLSHTFLSGKKISLLVSIVLFFILSWGTSWVRRFIPGMPDTVQNFLIGAAVSLGFTVLFYIISGWMMEKKLSL